MTAAATVVVTSRSFGSGSGDPAAALAEHELRVVRGPADHDPGTLAPLLADAVAWIAGAAPVTAAHLDLAPRLRVLARYGTGVDAVDLAAARRRRVVVTNTPGANAAAVAEHAVALTLACLRQVVEGDRLVRAGGLPALRGRELGAATVGIVGLGAVGRQVARLVAGFGSTVVAHDPFVAERGGATGRVEGAGGVEGAGAAPPDVEMLDFEALLARADVVSLHRPPDATPLVDGATLARMRPAAVLVNTARAGLLDEPAVAAALHAGALGALGADVLSGPDSPLLGAPRSVLTPHCAAQTTEAIDRMGRTAVAEVLRVVAHGEAPAHRVA